MGGSLEVRTSRQALNMVKLCLSKNKNRYIYIYLGLAKIERLLILQFGENGERHLFSVGIEIGTAGTEDQIGNPASVKSKGVPQISCLGIDSKKIDKQR